MQDINHQINKLTWGFKKLPDRTIAYGVVDALSFRPQ